VLQGLSRTGAHCVALSRVEPEQTPGLGNAGRVDLDPQPVGRAPRLHRIRRVLPKGPGTFALRFPDELRSQGLYAAPPEWLPWIEAARESLEPGRELTDGLVRRLMLAAGAPLYGAVIAHAAHDVGNPAGYRRCREALDRV
jgi:hypothetical protein